MKAIQVLVLAVLAALLVTIADGASVVRREQRSVMRRADDMPPDDGDMPPPDNGDMPNEPTPPWMKRADSDEPAMMATTSHGGDHGGDHGGNGGNGHGGNDQGGQMCVRRARERYERCWRQYHNQYWCQRQWRWDYEHCQRH